MLSASVFGVAAGREEWGLSMWRLLPQGGDFSAEKNTTRHLIAHKPERTLHATFQRQKGKWDVYCLDFFSTAFLGVPRRLLSSFLMILSFAKKNRPRGFLGRLCCVSVRKPFSILILSSSLGERWGYGCLGWGLIEHPLILAS